MSGVEALGLASSLLQVIAFAGETAKLCKSIYDGKDVPTDELVSRSKSLMDICEDVRIDKNLVPQKSDQDRELVQIAAECIQAAFKLESKLASIRKSRQRGRLLKSLHVSWKTIWHKKDIETLERSLEGYQKTLDTRFLSTLCTRNNLALLQQRESFKNLHQVVKDLMAQHAVKTTELLQAEHIETRKHAETNINLAEHEIKSHVSSELALQTSTSATQGQKQRLLRSLKYPGMNSRRNKVKDTHHDTLRWVLELERLEYDGPPPEFPSFVKWLESDGKVYWIRGKLGSGKSTLLRFLMEHEATMSALRRWHPERADLEEVYRQSPKPTVELLFAALYDPSKGYTYFDIPSSWTSTLTDDLVQALEGVSLTDITSPKFEDTRALIKEWEKKQEEEPVVRSKDAESILRANVSQDNILDSWNEMEYMAERDLGWIREEKLVELQPGFDLDEWRENCKAEDTMRFQGELGVPDGEGWPTED